MSAFEEVSSRPCLRLDVERWGGFEPTRKGRSPLLCRLSYHRITGRESPFTRCFGLPPFFCTMFSSLFPRTISSIPNAATSARMARHTIWCRVVESNHHSVFPTRCVSVTPAFLLALPRRATIAQTLHEGAGALLDSVCFQPPIFSCALGRGSAPAAGSVGLPRPREGFRLLARAAIVRRGI